MPSEVIGYADYAVIGCMLVVCAAVGIYFRLSGGRQKTTHEYLMAEKKMGIGPVAFSLMASYMSAIAMLGIPAEVYMYGTQLVMMDLGILIGNLLAAYGLIPVYFDLNVSTSYEYLEKRFGRTARTLSSIIFVLTSVLYMSVVVYAPSVALSAVTEFSTWTLVLTFVALATFYCYMGGLKAVLWTDVFQAILMYVPLLAIAIYAFYTKGPAEIYNASESRGQLIFFNMSPDPTIRYTFWNSFIAGLMYGSSYHGTNHIMVQRILSIGTIKKMQWAVFGGFVLLVLFDLSCILAGVILSSMFRNCDPLLDPQAELTSQDQLLVYLILEKFAKIPGLIGLCVAGILSAALSSLSSVLNSLSSVTVEDFIKPYCSCKSLTDVWTVRIAKILAIVFGASCLLLVFMVSNFRGVLEATYMLDSFLSGPLWGVWILGFFTTSANEPGAIIGLIVGIFFTGWLVLGAYLVKVPIPNLARSSTGCPTSLNDTVRWDEDSILNGIFGSQSSTETPLEEDRYVFPLYKVSFIWLFSIGTVVTFIIGLIASFFIRFCTKSQPVDLRYLSPFVRRFYTNTTSEHHKNQMMQEEVKNQADKPKREV